jgi:exocyst complex protein 7
LNRDLLRSIGEFEEYQPVEARLVRELRAIYECLSGNGYQLVQSPKNEPPGLAHHFGIPANRVVRTEKVGSGGYSNIVQRPLKTGFPQVDAYGEARKSVAFVSIDHYYRRVKQERKRNAEKFSGSIMDVADTAARDAVRCLEHAMVVVAGEKNVYRTVISPSLTKVNDEDAGAGDELSPFYRKACAASYSYVVACVVDKTMDVIESVFLKEGLIGHASGTKGGVEAAPLSVRETTSAAAAGLRMLDGVRMLGPSMAKLCDMPIGDGSEEQPAIASILCIAIHRTTVKNTARTLENLAKSIQEDPIKGSSQRSKDARVANLTCDVVRAVRYVSHYESAYKSVSKRRQLPWDPNMGEEAGELESFIRYLVMRLVNSLKGKALNYSKYPGDLGQVRLSLHFIFYCSSDCCQYLNMYICIQSSGTQQHVHDEQYILSP